MQSIKRYSLFSALGLMFALGVLVTFSSTVRANVLQTIEEIAGLRFDVTTDYPGDPGEKETIIPSEYLPLEEAQSRFPSPVVLPAYMPQGYERSVDVMFTPFTDPDVPMLTIIWENLDHKGNITLDILHCSAGQENCGLIVGEGALEEITLNGKPAVVVRGAWNYDTQQYDSSVAAAIRWKYDENTVYTLSTWREDILLDELIRIAESIP